MGNYPSEVDLKYIKEFDLLKRPVKELLDHVEQIWEYGDWGFKRTYHNLQLHTGGWSGNEDIIEALQHNFLFWGMYWQKELRGGHYYFNTGMVSKGKDSQKINRFI